MIDLSMKSQEQEYMTGMFIVCSFSCVGKQIESTCQPGSNHGLYYKIRISLLPSISQSNQSLSLQQNTVFGVFCNEHENAEFAIQLVQDAKSMTDTPDKR